MRAESEKRGGVYAIRNLVAQKEYVGSAVCIAKRIEKHIWALRRGKHCNAKLQSSWSKHGEHAFSFDVLAIVDNPALLLACEQEWLDALDTAEHGYNISPTAGSTLGRKHTSESRQRTSKAHTGKVKAPEHRAKIAKTNLGSKRSDETRQKMSEAKIGKPLSVAHRTAISAAHKGKPLSAEHRAAMLGRTFSAETRAKISAAKRGKPWSAARAAARAHNEAARNTPARPQRRAQ